MVVRLSPSIHAVPFPHPRLLICISYLLALFSLSAVPARSEMQTDVCGALAVDTVWTQSGSPYILTCDVKVSPGVTLTIQPGVKVKLDPGVSLQVDGTLVAKSCTFTSNQGSPARGDWGGILFSSSSVDAALDGNGNYMSGGLIQKCVVEYGGGGNAQAAIEVDQASPLIENNAIRHNANRGIYAVGRDVHQSIIIRNNTIRYSQGAASGAGINVTAASVLGNLIENNKTSSAADTLGGGGIYATTSHLRGNTVRKNRAEAGFGGGIYAVDTSIVENTVGGNVSAGRGGGIYASGGNIKTNTVSGNKADRDGGGGIYTTAGTLINNDVSGNTADLGGGVFAEGATVQGNTVSGNNAQKQGGGIYAHTGVLTENTITQNVVPVSGLGAGAFLADVSSFTLNTVTGNVAPGGTAGGISVSGQSQVHQNTLQDNAPYDAELITAADVDATLNYWGPLECTAIGGRIYDGNDDAGRGMLVVGPSLYAQPPLAALSIPAGLGIVMDGSSATLNWSPIPDPPAVGCPPPGWTGPSVRYHLYYDTAGDSGPYDGKGLAEGDSPIDVAQGTALLVNGLQKHGYRFAVTAYDYLGRESAFSNETQKPAEGADVFLPLLIK